MTTGGKNLFQLYMY